MVLTNRVKPKKKPVYHIFVHRGPLRLTGVLWYVNVLKPIGYQYLRYAQSQKSERMFHIYRHNWGDNIQQLLRIKIIHFF